MICDRCGYDNKEGALVCEHCGAVLVQPSSQTSEKYTYGAEKNTSSKDAPVNGYMSYTRNGTPRTSSERSPFTGAASSGPKEWIAYAAIICGALAIYSSPTIVPGILLGISAIIFGIVGLKTSKKSLAVIGIIAGAVGAVFSVLIIGAYIGLFNMLARLFSSSYGFMPFGW